MMPIIESKEERNGNYINTCPSFQNIYSDHTFRTHIKELMQKSSGIRCWQSNHRVPIPNSVLREVLGS